jgi:hypothetical protein
MRRFLLLAATATALHAQAAALVCGGVGSDERREISSAAQGANLELEFFIANRGNYVADVDVKLTPAAKGTGSLTVRTEGPICYLQVPPGRYRVAASFNGATKVSTATVPAAARRPVRLAMSFPETAAEGGPDIKPTPEEKAQARQP